jgi:hypothetical protein
MPHLFGSNRRPTGERGLYAYWRNGSKLVDANAFRALTGIASAVKLNLHHPRRAGLNSLAASRPTSRAVRFMPQARGWCKAHR